MTKPETGSIWQHKKGGIYIVVTTCTIEATDTPAVMYKSLLASGRDDFWVRPTDEFLSRFSRLDENLVALAEKLKREQDNHD
jgi:hypothetical protein